MESSSLGPKWVALRLSGTLLTIALLTLSACGSDAGDVGDTSSTVAAAVATIPVAATTAAAPAASATSATSTDAPSAFPVTIAHALGETTLESKPQRVVSVGFSDHDVLLALGVEPVAIRDWYGDYDYVWPWAEEALGSQTPTVLPSADINYEQIATLDPDLILAVNYGLEEDEYDKLAAIAPTVAHPADYPAYVAPWRVLTRTIGTAVGKSVEAEALIADVEDQFTAVRAAHPEFEGVGLAYAGVYGTDTANYYVEVDGSARMAVLQELGFVVPDELAALEGDGFYHDISVEQIELLEQDVVLWEPAVLELLPAVEDNKIYQSLAVAREDRDVFLTDPVIAGAMAHADVLSIPVVLESIVPELARAVANLNRRHL